MKLEKNQATHEEPEEVSRTAENEYGYAFLMPYVSIGIKGIITSTTTIDTTTTTTPPPTIATTYCSTTSEVTPKSYSITS